MTVLGFDPSLTCSGFAYEQEDGVHTGTIRSQSLRGAERLDFIEKTFISLLYEVKPSLIAYEGYAMGGPQGKGRLFDIGELGGVLKLVAARRSIPVFLVPPANLKQFATTKGNAKKPQVMKAIAELWKYSIKQDDEADAFVLMKMGEAFLNKRKLRTYDEKRRGSLAKCQVVPGFPKCN